MIFDRVTAPFYGATATENGLRGSVPAPLIADRAKFLRGDGAWVALSGGGDMVASSNLADLTDRALAQNNLLRDGSGNVAISADGTGTAILQGGDSGASLVLGTGATRAITLNAGTGNVQIVGATSVQMSYSSQLQPRGFVSDNIVEAVNSGTFLARKARGAIGAPTAVLAGDSIGNVAFAGYDGADYNEHQAVIQAWAAENFEAGHYGTDITFQVNRVATGLLGYVAMRIKDSGNLLIGTTSDLAGRTGGINAGGPGYFTDEVGARYTMSTGGATVAAIAANRTVIDNNAGVARVFGFGSDNSTKASFSVLLATADNSASATGMLISGITLATTFGGSITTATPSGGTAAAWNLGSVVVAGTSALLTDQYLEVEVAGALKKLALVSNS